MMKTAELSSQKLPASGVEREALRSKGQFWTPPWLAEVMASWITQDKPPVVFDPAVGPGTFFAAARAIGFQGDFVGFEPHSSVFAEGKNLGLTDQDFAQVHVADFISSTMRNKFPAIISNPPYIRHHRLSGDRKNELRTQAQHFLGFTLDGRVGLHLYFLLKCLDHLTASGRLAFLLPADVCEGVSSSTVWNRICELYRLEAVLTFAEEAVPFPQVDTNAIVFLISNTPPKNSFKWLQVFKRDGPTILQSLMTVGNGHGDLESVVVHERSFAEALKTGLSRPLRNNGSHGRPLSQFAKVIRGIATGANEIFFLTKTQIRALDLDESLFRRAVGRTRDCPNDILNMEVLDRIEAAGRPTWLLNLGSESKNTLPIKLQRYLEQGEQQGLSERALIKSRKPWYKMEQRTPPPILFAYLGRRECRFILNETDAVPLTGFLCVYPFDKTASGPKRLWRALNHPDTIHNLMFVGKSYGGGAIKVEPRQLDDLEIPMHVLQEAELVANEPPSQLQLLENPSQYSTVGFPKDK